MSHNSTIQFVSYKYICCAKNKTTNLVYRKKNKTLRILSKFTLTMSVFSYDGSFSIYFLSNNTNQVFLAIFLKI